MLKDISRVHSGKKPQTTLIKQINHVRMCSNFNVRHPVAQSQNSMRRKHSLHRLLHITSKSTLGHILEIPILGTTFSRKQLTEPADAGEKNLLTYTSCKWCQLSAWRHPRNTYITFSATSSAPNWIQHTSKVHGSKLKTQISKTYCTDIHRTSPTPTACSWYICWHWHCKYFV